ncbi:MULTISPECIES: DUF6448 family protein [Streptomyces]|uniref:DUF6448 family protein n=1 Tax=Streptomyces TaxID=1883 RepID=UPI00073E0DA5|nr:DUF6448 family protein [Streptomyces sp. EAS-AB2608]BCM72895.1 hypothetical protein EASAB2608_08229 [Streptomyces sp. EAS-AB2608]CUW33176.1 hypothetical protein TUE45_pSRTUE45c_0544 [Streptomyces reticuli]
MPPHCDSLDGPVVTAARKALEERDVDQVLPYVTEEGEPEVREAFSLAATVRALGQDAQEVADRWFFETVVRVHRSGEGASFTGLKPAGLGVGPVIPAAERALDAGSADALAGLLCGIVREQVEERLGRAMALKERAGEGVAAHRAYVEAGLGLQVWAHHLYQQAVAAPHAPTRRS